MLVLFWYRWQKDHLLFLFLSATGNAFVHAGTSSGLEPTLVLFFFTSRDAPDFMKFAIISTPSSSSRICSGRKNLPVFCWRSSGFLKDLQSFEESNSSLREIIYPEVAQGTCYVSLDFFFCKWRTSVFTKPRTVKKGLQGIFWGCNCCSFHGNQRFPTSNSEIFVQ